jgi:hypothetical protein
MKGSKISGQSRIIGKVDIIGSAYGFVISPCLLSKIDAR